MLSGMLPRLAVPAAGTQSKASAGLCLGAPASRTLASWFTLVNYFHLFYAKAAPAGDSSVPTKALLIALLTMGTKVLAFP